MPSLTGPTTARIRWDNDGQPLSTRYDDVYFSRYNGLEESRYVFLQQNALAERWRAGFAHDTFYIGETGFGTGLNFLAAWQLWAQSAAANKQLHFITVENEPLQKTDLEKALALWPELAEFARDLLAVYPQAPTAGFHPFVFAGGQVQLTLIVADASDGLNQLLVSDHPLHRQSFHRGMDAWFLDGFAPAKNPGIWQAELFNIIAALSTEHASLATFTAAGLVKRELQRVGFRIEKRPGYGKKREMLAAVFAGAMQTEADDVANQVADAGRNSPYPAPWHVQQKSPVVKEEKSAVIIGAGLAGSHTARALAERGWRVTVVEQAEAVANGASGNAQGIVYGKLSSDRDGLALFNLASLLYARRFYQPYWQEYDTVGEQCGVLQLAFNDKELRIQQKLQAHFAGSNDFLQFVGASRASEIAGIAIDCPALYFPQLGWLDPANLCRRLVDHPNITVRCKTTVAQLKFCKSSAAWHLLNEKNESLMSTCNLVIANAHRALDFAATNHLPLKPIRGQVSCFPDERVPLKTVLCSDGYISPANRAGLQSFGATFTLHEQRDQVLPSDHLENIANLSSTVPSLATALNAIDPSGLSGRASFRCTTADYLPLVGPVADYPQFVETFSPLRKNAKAFIASPGPYLPGLYLNVGHGSRGLAYTPLSAAILASRMNGDALPVARDLATALNPARFIIRDLIRNRVRP
ncbi:MAG: bifunctional tRNA (5-methylaminomethyl-2-thiouridine)(34)-methyltransferase MnmD/FAD-dependent 5-carboxymethylaminomethyl-2-thiouridine(34) oxidoreductase MnmC [Cellvibrionaceae bacterium]